MEERLRLVRRALGLNQRDMAHELGISQAAYSLFETGQRVIQTRYVEMLRIKYEVNPEWLTSGEGDMFLPSQEEEEFLNKYNELTDDNKELIEAFIEKLLKSQG